MTYQLDTSGDVGPFPATGPYAIPGFQSVNGSATTHAAWSDLDPFTQGYVEAALQGDARHETPGAVSFHRPVKGWAFSDLAPETLARIVEDCSKFRSLEVGPYRQNTTLCGRAFWELRGSTVRVVATTAFPPLTAYLGDDGKVYLREA